MDQIPGMIFTGEMIFTAAVNNGAPVPLYELAVPEGKPNINTLEGWTTLAQRVNRRSFVAVHGRDPVDDLEVQQWLDELTRGITSPACTTFTGF